MKIVLLDTCVWLDYIWQKKAKNSNPAKESKKVIDRLNGDNNYQIILSPFLIREISSHYKDWFVLQKVVEDGFSFNDFKQVKHKYNWEEDEKKEVDDIIIKIGCIKKVKVLITSDLNVKKIERILLFEGEYNFDIYDALHFNTAIQEKCDYFVTKDGKLRQSADSYNQKNKTKINCLPPKSFLRII